MFEKKRGTRFLASVMALVMLLSLAPVGALAAENKDQQENPAVTLPANGDDQKPVVTDEENTANTNEEPTPPPRNEGIATLPANNNNTPVALPETPVIVKPAEGLIDQASGVDADTSKDNGIAEYGNTAPYSRMIEVAVYATDGYPENSPVNEDIAELLGIPCKQEDGYYPIGVIKLDKRLLNKRGPCITSKEDWEAVKQAIGEIKTDKLKNSYVDGNVGNVYGSKNKHNKIKENLDKVQPDLNGTAGSKKTALFYWGKNNPSKNIEGNYEYHLDLRFASVCLTFEGVKEDDMNNSFKLGERVYLKDTIILKPGESKDFYLEGIPADYQIEGYYSDKSLQNEYNFYQKAETSATIYVKLVRKPVTITYDLNGGNLGGEDDDVVYNDLKVGDNMRTPSDPKREGYTFKGWKDEKGNPPSQQVTGDATYTAQWSINKHKVTYKDGANGAVFTDKVTPNVEYGAQIPQFGENGVKPTREGYTFTGWKCNVGNITIESVMPDQDVTFTAQWKAETVNARYFINLGGRDASRPDGKGTFTDGIEISEAINLVEFNSHAVEGYGNNGYIFNKEGVEKLYAGLLPNKPRNQQINDALSAEGKGNMSVGAEGRYIVWYHVSDCTNRNDGYHVDGYVANASITITYDPAGGQFADGNERSEEGTSGTSYTIIEETPVREGYTFTGWKLDGNDTLYQPEGSIVPTGDVTLVAQWEQNYTVIFDAQGGKWNDNESQKTTTYSERSASVDRPSEPTRSGYLFVAWTYKDINGNYEEIPNVLSLTVDALMRLPDVNNRTVTLYAKWRLNPADQVTYTIHQHFMKDKTIEDGAINYYTTSQVASAGTPISSLIPTELIDTYNFNGSKYLYEAAKIGTAPYTGQETLQADNTEIHLYYYLDSLKDADKDGTSTDKDSLTVGDDIPDYKQILIQYQVYQEGNGQVSPTFEVVTVKDDKELTAIHGSSVEKAGTGYTFVTWTGQNVAVTETSVGNIIDQTSAEKLKNPKCDLSGDTFEQGKPYTAIFLEDKIGGGDNKDQPDGIPDRYQVTVNYVSSDTSKGSVGTLTKEVLTIYENGKEGKWASKGKVTASGSTATATGNRCYFVNWTKKQEGTTDVSTVTSSANLTAQTFNAKGGDVYTFTANFDRSSGGGGGGSRPTVTIPDDVPTGLNGKDHYAYIIGYGNNDVRPQNNITRAEVATIFFRLLTDETREANMTKSNGYNDVKDGDWFCCAVSTLSKMGIIKGYEDGSFKPNDPISRAEFAAIAARFDPDGDKTPASFSDVTSHWAKDEISIAANHGWIKGYEDGSFKPDQKITRAETMTLVNRVLNRLPEAKDDLHKDMKTWVDNMDETAWYYLAVQEATNSHYFKNKTGTKFEQWTDLRDTRDWSELEK